MTIQNIRATATEWTTANPVLAAGEIGVEINTHKAKVGDGTTDWSSLPYIGSGGLPTGGTAGQIVAKIDGTDYNAQWIDNYTTDLEVYVKNNTDSTLNKGNLVYISGATGSNALISLSKANAEPTSSKTLGFLKQTLTTGSLGFVIKSGIIAGTGSEPLNTSVDPDNTSVATSEGQAVWLSPTNAGGWTTIKPTAPNHLVYLGVITRSHAILGEINITIQNGFEIDELHDTSIELKTSIADNEVLAFDTGSQLWKNQTPVEANLASSHTAGVASYGVPTGVIMMWYASTPPAGWLFCNGTSTSGYPALAAIVGATTPNLNGRVPVGPGSSGASGATNLALATTGGEQTHTLTAAESGLRDHTHTQGANGYYGFADAFAAGTLSGLRSASGGSTIASSGVAGGAQNATSALSLMQPYFVLNFIIKT